MRQALVADPRLPQFAISPPPVQAPLQNRTVRCSHRLMTRWLSRAIDEDQLFSCLKSQKQRPFNVLSSRRNNAGQICPLFVRCSQESRYRHDTGKGASMTAQPLKTIVLDLLRQGHLDEAAFLQGLGETERSAIGTPECWSAKDHIAHRTFWHQDLIQKVNATLPHQQIAPSTESEDQLNSKNFEKHKLRPWSELHAES